MGSVCWGGHAIECGIRCGSHLFFLIPQTREACSFHYYMFEFWISGTTANRTNSIRVRRLINERSQNRSAIWYN